MKPTRPRFFAMPLSLAVLTMATLTAAPQNTPSTVQPFKIIQTVPLLFPVRMLSEGVLHGEVKLALYVNDKGQLVDSLIVAYSGKEFADTALETVRRWKFVPSKIGDRSFGNVVHLTIEFENNGTVPLVRNVITTTDADPDAPAGTMLYTPCKPSSLDRPLRPTKVVQPDYPRALRSQGVGGKVRLSFYIDEKGQPRMVVSTSNPHPALATLAIAAVEAWRFEPPTSKGQPVLVSVVQEFNFVSAPGTGSGTGHDGGDAAAD